MARIRTVKPGFFEDQKVNQWPIEARYLYIGLFVYADDWGRFRDAPGAILGAVFPFDEDLTTGQVRAWLKVIEESGRIVRYEVAGDRYFQIRHWSRHQRVDRPSPTCRCPEPDAETIERFCDGAVETLARPSRDPRETAQTSAVTLATDRIGSDRIGVEGMGSRAHTREEPEPTEPVEPLERATLTACSYGVGDPDVVTAQSVYQHYVSKFHGRTPPPWKACQARITAAVIWLKRDACRENPEADLRAIIDHCAGPWRTWKDGGDHLHEFTCIFGKKDQTPETVGKLMAAANVGNAPRVAEAAALIARGAPWTVDELRVIRENRPKGWGAALRTALPWEEWQDATRADAISDGEAP